MEPSHAVSSMTSLILSLESAFQDRTSISTLFQFLIIPEETTLQSFRSRKAAIKQEVDTGSKFEKFIF